MATKRTADEMSRVEDQDPDYEMMTTVTSCKRQRLLEQDAKDVTVKRIEMIIRKQFDIEMRHKEKEVILIDERIHQVRAILDKLRGCIVASYYGNVSSYPPIARGEQTKRAKLDLNHPAIQRVIKQTTDPSPPTDATNEVDATVTADEVPTAQDTNLAMDDVLAVIEGSNDYPDIGDRPETPQTPMLNGDISELLSGCSTPDSEKLSLSDNHDISSLLGPSRNTGENAFGVGALLPTPKPANPQASSEDGSRFHVKKRIIVGNVSKYISPENREDSDPSTHKWMVYVRGPHDEPRIDHFVKKIWFFLHPSYRPNDLVEVKEPPFHLTRRGWGEFPIRVQLHFVDPRNKKVDIIHHLKLDRTYTGLQTLGAETIVDVELDRYLFDEAGQPVSRPSTPTVTSVKYKEGCKPEPSSPGANVAMPTTPSPLLPDSRAKTPSTPMELSPAPSPLLQGACKDNPILDIMLPPCTKSQTAQSSIGVTLGTMNVKEQGHAITGIIGAGGIVTKTQIRSLSASAGQLAVQQQQGGRFVRVMPPLGPITSQAKMTANLQGGATTIAKAPLSVMTQSSDTGVPAVKCAVIEGDKTTLFVSSNSGNSPPITTVSSTTTAVNVAEAAASTSPGKGALAVRIQEGKLVADVSPTAQLTGSTAKPSQVSAAVGLSSATAHLPTVSQILTSAGQIQSVTKISPQQAVSSTLQMAGAVSPPGKLPVPVVPTQPKLGSAGGIKVIPTRTTAVSSPTHGPPSSFPIIPNPPPGTQYYITAKSTDPNLQGKVILIPQQVFAQASGQSVLVGSKGGRPGASQIQGKGGAALKPTPATKSSFLSPSNVLILPQGSIVPPLPPGSIVQIQQVPSPSRTPQPQTKPRLAVPQKSISTPSLVGAKAQVPRVAGLPSGGIIQIQRTSGSSVAKVLPSSTTAASTSGISILPEKGTLAKTPSGGVVFVQRSPSTGKLNAQPVTGISVAGQSGIPQKVALAAQLASAGTLKPGSTVSIIQAPGKPMSAGQTVVLQSPTSLPKLQQVKTIQQSLPRTTQPIILGQSPGASQGHIQGKSQALLSQQGKVQLVSVIPEKKPEKLAVPELPIVGQTPMALSHEVTVETSNSQRSTPNSQSSTPDADAQSLNESALKTEAMEVDTTPADTTKTVEVQSEQPRFKQEPSVQSETAIEKQPDLKPTISIESNITSSGVAPHPTAVVTSHGLVQVQGSTELPVTQLQTLLGQHTTTTTSSAPTSTSTSSPLARVLQVEKIQIKQEVVSPPKVTCNVLTGPGTPSGLLVPITPNTLFASSVSSAPTTISTPNTVSTLLGPTISRTILRPISSSTLLGPNTSSTILGPSASTALLGSTTSSTILRPSASTTILGSTLPSTLMGTSSLGHPTIIVASALPQVISIQNDKIKDEVPEDPLLIELQRRSREGPVSVYGLETMEELMEAAVKKIPLVYSNRVQSEHPFMATSEEHFYSWTTGKRRGAEWQRALAVKDVIRDAVKRSKNLKDAEEWSTKKIMWWCRRHGCTPPDPESDKAKKTRQWCDVCGEVEQQDEDETAHHNCTSHWLSSSGLLQNTSYTISDEFVQALQDKQRELGRDDDDSDIEIDVISISTDSRQVRIKKEVEEDNNRIKCFLPPSDGARLVTDTAHEIGVQFKPVEIANDTYASITQEMVFTATKHFMSNLVRGAFAKAYGNRKDHRFSEEILPTHVFQTVKENKHFDFLTNKYLGIPMPTEEERDKEETT